jgi:hypothetical protein
MLFDGPFGDHQAVSDSLIGSTLGHELQHLPLAVSELVQ